MHNLSKTALFSLLLAFSFLSFGQRKNDLLRISPKWSVGDHRKIHVELNTKLSYNDSVVKNDQKSYDIQVKVIETRPNLIWKWTSYNDEDLYIFKNPENTNSQLQKEIGIALKNAEYEVLSSDLKLEMNPKNHEFTMWVNGLELVKNAEFHQKKVLKTWCLNNEIPTSQHLEIELKFSKKLNEGFKFWKEMLLAKANSVFSPYQVGFDMDKTITDKIFTRDILQLNDTDTEFPGNLTKTASEVNDKLILVKKLTYDKDFITLYLQKMGGSFTEITPKEVMIFEDEQSIFDLKTRWLQSHTKKLYFEVKGMKTTTRSTTTYQ